MLQDDQLTVMRVASTKFESVAVDECFEEVSNSTDTYRQVCERGLPRFSEHINLTGSRKKACLSLSSEERRGKREATLRKAQFLVKSLRTSQGFLRWYHSFQV